MGTRKDPKQTQTQNTTTNYQGAFMSSPVTPEEQEAIKSQAARWRYELEEGFYQFRRGFSVPGWLFSWLAGAAVLYGGRRRALRTLW